MPMEFWFLMLLTIHFIGDFVLQSHWMRTNKCHSDYALLLHVCIYTGCFMICTSPLVPVFGVTPWTWLEFGFVNGILHLITDRGTSRITDVLLRRNRIYDFFVVVGLDQLFHQAALILTTWYIIR